MKHFSLFALLVVPVLLVAVVSVNASHPGRENLIADVPDSLQMFGAVAYNSRADEYFAVYAGKNQLCGVRITPRGQVLANTRIAPVANSTVTYNIPGVAYNAATDAYLVTYRHSAGEKTQSIRSRFVSGNGALLSGETVIANGGGEAHIAYNGLLNNYMVAWSRAFQHTNYRMLDGTPSNNALIGTNRRVETDGWRGHAAFSSGANKFLFVNGHEHTDGTNGSDIWGRFVTADGSSIGPRFPIANTGRDETSPTVAYAPSTNEWMVMWQRFVGSNRSFDIEAGFVDENGNVEKFFVVSTELWDAPGDVVYNAALDRFVVAWFAGSGPRLGLVNPHDGSFTRILPDDSITTPKNRAVGDGFNALATRPNLQEPQAFVYWREGHGLSGAHGTIVNLATGDEIPVIGGGIPCSEPPDSPDVIETPVVPEPEEPLVITLSPEPEPELKVEKFVRNVTEGQTASHNEILEVSNGDIIQFITLITSQTDRTVAGLVVHDQLPAEMTFREGSTLIDGSRTDGRDIIEDGLNIGSIEAGGTRTVRWTAQISDVQAFDGGVNTLELPVVVTTDDAGTFFSNSLLGLSDAFVAARSTGAAAQAIQRGLTREVEQEAAGREAEKQPTDGIFGAGMANTGAGGTILFSILGATLASLAYAGYTRSHRFHRRQVSRITDEREPMDFRP